MKSYIVRLEQKVESQQKQITDIVSRNMRENAIFTGIPEAETDLRAYLKTFFSDDLGLNGEEIKIDRVHRFGQKNDNRPRPVVAHFHDFADREDIRVRFWLVYICYTSAVDMIFAKRALTDKYSTSIWNLIFYFISI